MISGACLFGCLLVVLFPIFVGFMEIVPNLSLASKSMNLYWEMMKVSKIFLMVGHRFIILESFHNIFYIGGNKLKYLFEDKN